MKKNFVIFFILTSQFVFSQNVYILKGKVTDAVTKDPIPFASINIKNTSLGKNTDFEGNFQFLLGSVPSDSLLISCLGYFSRLFYISKDSLTQTIYIQLNPSEILLQEVKVYAGENPAHRILRKTVAAKSENNYKKLNGFDYASYNKIEVDFNKISEKLRQRRITQKVDKAIKETKIQDCSIQ